MEAGDCLKGIESVPIGTAYKDDEKKQKKKTHRQVIFRDILRGLFLVVECSSL
jgi:hypothetical protein